MPQNADNFCFVWVLGILCWLTDTQMVTGEGMEHRVLLWPALVIDTFDLFKSQIKSW